jgi:hypothetical protein
LRSLRFEAALLVKAISAGTTWIFGKFAKGSLEPMNRSQTCTAILSTAAALLPVYAMQSSDPLPPSVEKVCAISFVHDTRRPARVEDSGLHCIQQAARRLKERPDLKLVLVGLSDPAKDYAADENGKMRETEDKTGYDVRLEDLAAYRSLNAKWYLVRWLGIAPARILPTTDESLHGQDVTFYLVPGTADFNHNYLGTTKTNENPCTVKPCYPPDEETLTAQPRPRIAEPSPSSAGEKSRK